MTGHPSAAGRTSGLPILPWLAGYRPSWLRLDVIAGLTAAAVVAPKAMAIADIAGLPVQLGLYTALVPMLVYVLLGTSRPLSVSSTATIGILTGGALAAAGLSAAQAGPAAATLALLVGVFLFAACVLKLGFLADFISASVLTGFKAGVGVVLIIGQLGAVFGVDTHGGHTLWGDLSGAFAQMDAWHPPTMALAVGTVALILALERRWPHSPAPLIGVAAGIALSAWAGEGRLGIAVIGAVPAGLPAPALPDLGLAAALWAPALGIALMSFTESIATAGSFVERSDPPLRANRELLALGAGNVAGSLFGAMPAGGGASQTAVNQAAGARSQAAQAVTALVILLVLLFLSPALALMPKATLAAVVIVSALGLIKVGDFRAIARVGTPEFRWALAAALGVMILGVLNGIVVAVLLSLAGLIHLGRRARPVVVGRDRESGLPRPLEPGAPVDRVPGLLIARPQGMIYFGNASILRAQLQDLIAAAAPVRVLVLDARTVPYFEYSGLQMLDELREKLADEGIALWIANVQPFARRSIERSRLGRALGERALFERVQHAIAAFESGAGPRSSPAGEGESP